ncbi:MAG: efflux transporter outer membrane subunit [Bryobacteraceae bacterium]|nr:efflux transporter outer membrane subunit [Bryobacteraceae bacterium]
MKRLVLALVFAAVAAGTGCRKSTTYQRPSVPTPQTFRGVPPSASAGDTASLGDSKWFDVFQDEALRRLIRRAETHNYDVREAVARVAAAQAAVGITRADQLPTTNVAVDATTLRISRGGNFPLPPGVQQNRTFGSVAANLLSYEVDIWGRLRSATDAARAEVLAAEENRNAVRMMLVGDLAAAYFQLLGLDQELEIARRTLETREGSLRLIRLREERGLATKLEVREGEQLVYTATQVIPQIQQQIAQTENRISLLTGAAPGEIERGVALSAQQQPPEIPAGLPSALLERRPDIRAGEQQLVAAQARIDAARAAFFPRISLTGLLGSQSNALSSLFSPATGVWQFVPQVSQPVFTGGRLRSQAELARSEQQIAVVQYERAIQTAFREVADALAAHRHVRVIRGEQEMLLQTLRDRARLSYLRYTRGVDPLLAALDADRDLFEAELALTRTRRDELVALVQLYRALGGGWQ